MPQEKRNFLPLLQQGFQETAVFGQIFFPVWGVEVVASIGSLPKDKLVRDRLAAMLIDGKPASPQKPLEVDAVQAAQRDDLLDVPWRGRQRFVVGKGAWRREVKLIRESARNPAAHARCLPERQSHAQARALEKILETRLNVQRLRLGQNRRPAHHRSIVIPPNWADFSVHDSEDLCFPSESQFELRARSLWRMQHDSVFFKHQELRTGKPGTMLNKEEPWFGVILPFRQHLSGTPRINSDDAARCKVWKRMHFSFANFGVKKSSLT